LVSIHFEGGAGKTEMLFPAAGGGVSSCPELFFEQLQIMTTQEMQLYISVLKTTMDSLFKQKKVPVKQSE
jgi:hypothetical protein